MNRYPLLGDKIRYSDEYLGLLVASFWQRGFIGNCTSEELSILVQDCIKKNMHFVIACKELNGGATQLVLYRRDVYEGLGMEGEGKVLFDSAIQESKSFDYEVITQNRYSM